MLVGGRENKYTWFSGSYGLARSFSSFLKFHSISVGVGLIQFGNEANLIREL